VELEIGRYASSQKDDGKTARDEEKSSKFDKENEVFIFQGPITKSTKIMILCQLREITF